MRDAEKVTFGGSGLDRAAQLRKSPPMAEGTLALWRGRPAVSGDAICWLPSDSPVLAGGRDMVFLGLDEGRARFACDISHWAPEAGAAGIEAPFADPNFQPHPALPEGAGFAELRKVMAQMTARDAELVATAKALLHWHRSHGFCAACGSASAMADGGWRRECPACGAQHFPRTDPVVIMLVTDGNRLLLGRSHGWAERMHSCLAGFVEPGETMEAAVRREVAEETAIQVGEVRYLASQPWPFPASLMLGCIGKATSRNIAIDPSEIEAARWATREEVLAAIAGTHPEITMPREGSIARFLITRWLADDLV